MNLRKETYLCLILIFFGILFSLISFVNHYYFRTYALDLGAYTNALYDYIHFRWNDGSVFKAVHENLLSDHFDLYLILFSPFSIIFRSYTLLIIQILFLLSGGVGIYRYFLLGDGKSATALAAVLYFFLFFGIFSAISFDYHSNVVAASLAPWFFYLLKKRKILLSVLLFVLILISKENTSLWMGFICLGLLVDYRKEKAMRNFLILSAIASFLYFVIIVSVVMPALSIGGSYPHFNYSVLGNNPTQAIQHLFIHPLDSIRMFFTNHTHHPFGDYVKLEFLLILVLAGLPVLFFKPQYLFMMIPLLFQKLFNDTYTMWGIDAHYNIEFAPIMAIGIFSVIGELRNRKWRLTVSLFVLLFNLSCTLRVMDNTIVFTNKSRIRIYQSSHYSRDFSVKKVYAQISRIPEDAIVCAQSPILPHLAYRDKIYQFPMIRDANYIIYSHREETYPLEPARFDSLTRVLENSKEWLVLFNDKDVTLLMRSAIR
jgi:uncharacterized membrane protein